MPVPDCGPVGVRVRVCANAISVIDLLLASGGYQGKPPTPFVPGSEFRGVIDAVGSREVNGLRVGDRVCGVRHGAWTEMLCLSATAVQRLGDPDEAHCLG